MKDHTTHQPHANRKLSLADFSFHGFGPELGALGRRLQRLEVRAGEPAAPVVEDAIFVPSGTGQTGRQRRSVGGLFHDDGRPVGAADLRRRGRSLSHDRDTVSAAPPDRTMEEEVVYLGPLFSHFGRVLLESLARVWVLDQLDPTTKVAFDFPNAGPGHQAAWVPRLLSHFGVPPERVEVFAAPTRLRRVIIPEPLFEQHLTAHLRLVDPFRAVADRLAADVSPSPQPLYLSRRLLSSRQRAVVGEARLEASLEEHGFLIAHPQTMPFAEQVRLINRHAEIYSSVGSAAHAILFARQRPSLHLLTWRDNVPLNYFLCSAIADVPTTFINSLDTGVRPEFGEDEGTPSSGAKLQSTPQRVHLPAVLAYLAEQGHQPRRHRAVAAQSDPSPTPDDYDEQWLYARLRKSSGKRGLPLPPALEAEAVSFAAGSWPVSWALARYFALARGDAARADRFARQFADLVSAERDPARLAYFQAELANSRARVSRLCTPETAALVSTVMADRFPLANGEDELESTDAEPFLGA